MKVIGWLAGLATILTAAVYLVVSLNRWEWNRALFFGLIILIAEVAMATALVLRKLDRLLGRSEVDPDVEQIIRASRPPGADRFAWLRESQNRTNVFITFLVGGGIVLSGAAWLVDRLASTTTTPQGERELARALGPLSYPRGGLVVDEATLLAQDVPGEDDADLQRLLHPEQR
ncbi:MAG: hypothetical protein M3Z03_06135 [Actinomycetota bacterium]|nr:hypothetical protein [Actinomycetota bacterium]